MSIIGEAILTVSIEMLLKKLGSDVLPLFGRQEKIRSDLEDWRTKLMKIKSVLNDAEEKQIKDENVKYWLGELQNLAYDVEDILDEFATEAFERDLSLRSQPKPSTSKFQKLISTCCTNFSTRSVEFDSMMRRRIDEVTARLEKITSDKSQLGLNEKLGENYKIVRQRLPETSLVTEAKVHGRQKDKETIVQLLLRDDLTTDGNNYDGFSVVSILGMGGIGKTTVAQLVYNDERTQNHFDLKAWTCVSEDFDVIRITKTILSSTAPDTKTKDDLNSLQEELRKELVKKKFLLVLDDIWNEDPTKWDILSRPFEAGAPGSKIIATARSQDVASTMRAFSSYELKKLSDADCLIVFTQSSFGTRDFRGHEHLEPIGKKLVTKCDGLPLAAKTLGGLLRNKYNHGDWEEVLNSKIWELSEEKSSIMQALRVSYFYLPAHLKQCFAYCSLLPKKHEFCEMEIILLWMAEGLLKPYMSGKEMEEIGHAYFKELQLRSFLQQLSQDPAQTQASTDKSLFVMHDLIHDLAQCAAGETYFTMEDMMEDNKQQKSFENLRHLSYSIGQYDGIKRFEPISDVERLRTFLPVVPSFSGCNFYLSYRVVHALLKLRCLRVLSLCRYQISEIPNSIGALKLLRHLDLSETQIETLPESVNTLYNLHTLLLENCYRLKKFCPDMGNLIKLRHLNNSNVHSLEEMPKGIGKLTCLQTLSYFVVREDIASGLGELNSLKNLRGMLKISRLENEIDVGDARKADLNGKRKLNELFLQWTASSGNSREPETETRVLDMLRPHENLKELTIQGYGGTKFPIWLGNSLFKNLVLLKFEYCSMCTSLPSVGQLPSLKHLSIIGIDRVKRVGPEFYGSNWLVPFSSLEMLYFQNMLEWEEWVPQVYSQKVEVFSKLRELSLVRCSKLQGKLPEHLPALERLVIEDCEELIVSLPSMPILCELKINGCKKVERRSTIHFGSLKLVSIDMSNQVFITRLLRQELPDLEELVINNNKELTCLWQSGNELLHDASFIHKLQIGRCPQLLSLVAEEEEDQQLQGLPGRLHYLGLYFCKSLVKLPQALLSLSTLKEIGIAHCDSLKSLTWMNNANASLESLIIHSCDSLTHIARVQLLPSLKQMNISNCKNLRTLIDEDQVSVMGLEKDISSGSSRYASVLEQLNVKNCSSLTSLFSKSELPATLESINVKICPELTCLSSRGNLPKTLKHLSVYQCSKLESIAEWLDDNTSLESIDIWDCENLKVLPNNLHKACHLQRLYLSCPNLVSFPEGGLPCAKLIDLLISRCKKLKALPNGMHNLTSLEDLVISNSPNIESLPEDGFPTNLRKLGMDYMKISKALFNWRFSSIKVLSLYGGGTDVVSFPPDDMGMALPASLIHLQIKDFRNLERLSQNLTSLEYLDLSNCPMLKYFPEKGLPSSLLRMSVSGCPLIKKRCQKDKGEYWHLIADIPYVLIDGSFAL